MKKKTPMDPALTALLEVHLCRDVCSMVAEYASFVGRRTGRCRVTLPSRPLYHYRGRYRINVLCVDDHELLVNDVRGLRVLRRADGVLLRTIETLYGRCLRAAWTAAHIVIYTNYNDCRDVPVVSVLDRRSGRHLYQLPASDCYGLAISEGEVFVSDHAGLRVFSIDTGRPVRTLEVKNTPGCLYVTRQEIWLADQRHLRVLDRVSGTTLQDVLLPYHVHALAAPDVRSMVVLAGKTVYLLSQTTKAVLGTVCCLADDCNTRSLSTTANGELALAEHHNVVTFWR